MLFVSLKNSPRRPTRVAGSPENVFPRADDRLSVFSATESELHDTSDVAARHRPVLTALSNDRASKYRPCDTLLRNTTSVLTMPAANTGGRETRQHRDSPSALPTGPLTPTQRRTE